MVFKKLGFNEYKIEDDIAIIFITKKDGIIFEVIVDAEDIPYLIELDFRWHVTFDPTCDCYRVSTAYYYDEQGKRRHTNLYLNNIIMKDFTGIETDHVNHNPLDNRKINLRTIEHKSNAKNRKGRNKNNKSGHRNVCFICGFYRIQLQIDGKNYLFPEKFLDVENAGMFAEEMRLKHYGEFAGFK